MRALIDLHNIRVEIDLKHPIDISISMKFNEAQPNTYDVELAKSEPFRVGTLIGDTRQGGSCNFDVITIIPHCNGTHTECIGHLTNERISINKILQDTFIPCTLITIPTESIFNTNDTYEPLLNENDKIITRSILKECLLHSNSSFLKGLIIRTTPNDKSKISMKYSENESPFFSIEAMEFIYELGIEHLLVDFPSLDRAYDDGMLTAHHIFWNISKGSHLINNESRLFATVTEMIYVDENVENGNYLLNLQIAPFESDASPSRPIIYKVK